jgi:hypothetical protein
MFQRRAKSRVLISHRQQSLIILIYRDADYGNDLVGLLAGPLACFPLYILYTKLAQVKSIADFLLLLAVFLPSALGGFWIFSKFYSGAFGTEEVIVSRDTLLWTRKAPFWTRKSEMKLSSISSVLPKTPWDGINNSVEVISNGKCYEIGDRLLPAEAIAIARELQAALRR